MSALRSPHALVVACALGLLTLLRPTSSDAQAPLTPSQVQAAAARYHHEPSIDAVLAEALRAPPLDPERARDALSRARLAGLLPQARAEVRRGQGLDLSSLQSTTGERSLWASDDTLTISGGVTFQLDRLLFAREESALLRELRALEERRLQLVTQIVHLYFERRRLQLERDLRGHAEVPAELRILEIEALLDVFTQGAFSRMLGRPIEAPTPRSPPPTSGAVEER